MANNGLQGLGDETLANAQGIRNSIDDIQDSTTKLSRALGESTKRYSEQFEVIRNSANKVAEIQNSALKSSKATGEAFKEQAKQSALVRTILQQQQQLYKRVRTETGETKKNILGQIRNLADAARNAKQLASVYGNIAEDSAKLDQQTKWFDRLAQVAKGIPALGKLATPFQKAAEAARKVAAQDENASMRSKTGAAMKAMGGEMLSMAGGPWTAIAAMLAKLGKFIIDIFIGAQEQVVDIQRNMSVTKDSANAIQGHFSKMGDSAAKTYVNTESLIKAQSELSDQMQRAGLAADSTLEAQTFLTERMKMSGDAAAVLTARSEQMGESAESVVDSIMQQNKEDVKRGKSLTTQKSLLTQISKVTGQIAASFGFSNKSIAEGVKKVNQFGLGLEQAAKVSASLLNFEDSIGSELEAELLTGKQFNLEKARSKALTGDIAGATADVMAQMQNLTEEQRKSPLIMESLAKMSGLSTDEIQNAYLIQKDRTKQEEKLVEIIKTQGKEAAVNYMNKMGFAQSSMAEAQKSVKLQEAWDETLTKMKSQLMGLVGSGAVDTLVEAMQQFAKWVGDFTGISAKKAANEGAEAVRRGTLSKSQNEKLQEQAQGGSGLENFARGFADSTLKILSFGQYDSGLLDEQGRKTEQARSILAKKATERIPVKDFVIKPMNEDTITMAGGTKLGGNVEALLQELIVAVKQGGNIYLGTNKLNESIGLNLHPM